MVIKTETILKDFDGNDIQVKDEIYTVRSILISALMYQTQQLMPTAEQSIRAYTLGLEISTKSEVELKSDDVVFIKARLLVMFSPLIFGQMVALLEGEKPIEESTK